MTPAQLRSARAALDTFTIETPSWGFADTGTRFGKFFQAAAAIDLGDKLAGSFGNNDARVRAKALQHCVDSVAIGKAVGSEYLSLWFADGTNYPGQADLRARKGFFETSLQALHRKLGPKQTMLVEYKPFEPAFYATDVADWGMAYLLAKKAGPRAKVLVDTGHHYSAQNIEQIVAWLLDEDMLGGFHFNDRRYADDDLTLGSIDPYQVFRIFHEIHFFASERRRAAKIAYMIDQSHNEKPKIEATIQTVVMAQELYAKAALVDHNALRRAQSRNNVVDAELILKRAFFTDVTPALSAWRRARGLPLDPLGEHRRSGYERAAASERTRRRKDLGLVQGGSYA